jgi:hypothetical protein
MQVKAIETQYKGYRFRSRLEARWAVFFDSLRIEWQYEPEGYDLGIDGLYLPDFWLPQVSMFAEVKPGRFDDNTIRRATALAKATGHEVLMLEGTPACRSYFAVVYRNNSLDYVDFVMGESHGYHLYEHRFYASTGASYPVPADIHRDLLWCDIDGTCYQCHAVEAARSARFEHGEGPTIIQRHDQIWDALRRK